MNEEQNASPAVGEEGRRTGTVDIRAEVVRRECRRRLWTIAMLAERAGLHRSTLDRLPDEGPVRMHVTTVDRIARAFEAHGPRELVDEMLAPPAGGGR